MSAIAIIFRLIAYQGAITQAWKIIGPIVGELVGSMSTDVEVKPSELLANYNTAWLQASLKRLGSPDLVEDGEYGDDTKAAVEAFQKAHPPLKADGQAGVQTIATVEVELEKLRAKA